MNPALLIAIFGLLGKAIELYMDLTGKDVITRDDLKTDPPEEILKKMGIEIGKDRQ